MGQITLQIPQTGALNSTEDPKVASDFTTIQTLVNGNLEDSNLKTPNNAVRRLLLQANGFIPSAAGSTDYLMATVGGFLASGSSGSSSTVPLWIGDAGLSSQPQDFQVPNLTAYARIRMVVIANATTAPASNFTAGLYQITASAGGTSNAMGYTFSTALSGSTVTVNAPSAGVITSVETAQFALPSSGVWALGAKNSATPASHTTIALQLFGYNA